MMRFLKSSAILIGLAVFTLACQDVSATGRHSEEPDSEPTLEEAKTVVMKELKTDAYSMRNQTKTAIRDLASREKVALNAIKPVRVESVTWQDGSLGCPKKGMSYTQAQVPGVLIVLSVDSEEHEYHAANGGAPAYCAKSKSPVEDIE